MKKILVLIMVLILTPSVLAGTITRDFSSTSLSHGETLSITYTADGTAPYIRQPIPTDWTLTDDGGGTLGSDNILRASMGTTMTIQLQAPNKNQDYNFEGDYIIDGSLTWIDFPIVTVTVSSVCTEDWQVHYEDCQTNDLKLKYYTDNNNCGTTNDLPSDNGTYVSCNYCDSTWDTTLGECIDGTQTITYTYTNNCCAETGLSSDCNKPADTTQSCGINKLSIEKVKITYDGKSKTAHDGDTVRNIEPGMDLRAKIYVENLFTDEEDIEMEDVEITVTIESIDDGDDLEEESDEFDIKAGKTKSETLSFEIPLLVDEDEYTMIIEVEGEDENNTKHEAEATIELEVEKEKHKLIIHKAILDPNTLSCDGETFLDLKVINLGSEDEEEVVITLINDELNFNKKETIELDSGDDEETIFSGPYLIDVPEDLKVGTYPVEIKVFYNTDRLEDTEKVDLIIEECEVVEKVEKEEEEEVEVITPEEEEEEIVTPPVIPKKTFWDKYGLAVIIVGYVLVIIVGISLVVKALKK